ncbi:hypothetical protein KUTeg_024386 [Tegillarca granosa]|uniref:BHLH domain-containing protein n=1 Tax=Tegillarca granosa TaxID=220873 RepID=A0ABQ9E2V0_TEGGR|nr:hypothetical protein KUTeg_024386 [Tegillarca granosa]
MDSPDSVRVTSSSGDHFTPSDKQKDESKRTARKIGEKLRRERLNGHLTQLSEQIPWIAESERRLDKVSILRLTVNYMKLHHGLKKRKLSGVWQPSVVDKQMIKGYFQEVDVIGNSIYNIVHPDDHAILETQFSCKQGQESHITFVTRVLIGLAFPPCKKALDIMLSWTTLNSAYNERRSFYIHMQNLTNGENENQYERVHVLGHMRFLMKLAHSVDDTLLVELYSIDDTWLVASCRIEDKQPILEVSQFYANKNEFISQHAMDVIVFRVAVITGFMASDRVGESVYSLINPEDLDAVAVSHMKNKNKTSKF